MKFLFHLKITQFSSSLPLFSPNRIPTPIPEKDLENTWSLRRKMNQWIKPVTDYVYSDQTSLTKEDMKILFEEDFKQL